MTQLLTLALAATLLLVACEGESGPVDAGRGDAGRAHLGPQVELDALPYARLSQYRFFRAELRTLTPVDALVPFEPVSPLWSDHAEKQRLLYVPKGEQLGFAAEGDWTFPTGTVAIKSFFFPADMRDPDGPFDPIETRLLVRGAEGFEAYVYLWNEQRTDAELLLPGRRVSVEYIDEDGEPVSQPYQVPNQNQCGNCHDRDDEMYLLGVNARQLAVGPGDSTSALERFADEGLLDIEPPPVAELAPLEDPRGDGALDGRARAWLEANCAHCHRSGGGGGRSGLVLLASEREPVRYGVCKAPVAAGPAAGGFSYDVVPGDPDRSIFVHRMESDDPEIRMPELPVLSADPFGNRLVREWIQQLTPAGCDE